MEENTINTELAEKILNFSKKLFKEYSGITLEYARELIELEDRVKALKPNKTNTQTNKKLVEQQNIVKTKTIVEENNLSIDDLPF